MAVKVKVVDTRRIPSSDPNRMGKYDQLVVYETGPGQRYAVVIPDEEFTEERLKRAIQEDLQERGKWVGKEFEV